MATLRPKPTSLRAVLDTELVLSALVLSGRASTALRRNWQSRRFTPLVSKATAGALIRALACPEFALTKSEQQDLMFDYLLFCEIVEVPIPPPSTPTVRSRFDASFLELAMAGRADCLVTSRQDLLSLDPEFSCSIVRADDFLAGGEFG